MSSSWQGKSKDLNTKLKKCFPGIIFCDEKMEKVLKDLQKIAPSSSPVLILGETGTGKELIAKAVHKSSGRVKNNLITINCSAIPENILEAELFGYEKGAFTGADRTRSGILDSLEGGTLFLDEIGDMPLRIQAKLLRVLQEKKYRPLGGGLEKTVDVRFIAATNKDLEQEVKEKRFRSDLFYRLNVLPLKIPSLRERKKDIPLLFEYFLDSFRKKNKVSIKIKEEVSNFFCHYSWPGNVRELYNFVERICLMKEEGLVSSEDIPPEMKREILFSKETEAHSDILKGVFNHEINLPESGFDLDAHLNNIANAFIKEALKRTQNNKKEAAKLLALKRTTLIERIKKRVEGGGW